ncbi:MAG TPA: lysylphosphatidylglycerol synthase transmembrane domain-containing protein [Gemmatimonadaceae bacterium]|nr:lysylphosphatidylglycerol synthase transmembrane domain-containing protein [Gemmatimonadaceae bacterium]
MSTKRWMFAIVSFVAAIGVSLYIVISSWPRQHAAVSMDLGPHLVLLGIALSELLARGAKVWLSAIAMRIPMSYRLALRASAGGDFGAAITPNKSGAEPARYLIMTEDGMRPAQILLVIYAELFLEMISLALVAVALYFLFRNAGSTLIGVISAVGLYSLFVLGTGALGWILSAKYGTTGPPPRWARRLKLRGARWRKVQRALATLRTAISGIRHMRIGMTGVALLASILHIGLRIAILPAIVYSLGEKQVPLAPLVLWPVALMWGSAVSPLPGGGGAIEVGFKAALEHSIPARIFGAALIWWRFYTFYLFILLGALAAGGTVLRALRDDDVSDSETEEEIEPATA